MPTIYDVARRAQVSTYTVSSVLNRSAQVSPELTKRVMEAVQELDYTINDLARSLQTRRTTTVGMLIPDIANPFYAKVVRGVEDVLRASGYSLILGSTYNDRDEQARYVNVFRSKQVDGLVIFVAPGDDSEVRAMIEAKKPVVFVGRVPMELPADSVSADHSKGTQLAITHLLNKGHQRIALLNGQAGLSSSADRINAWKRTLKRAGCATPSEYIWHGDWTAASGEAAMQHLFALSAPPTAIFAANFLMMIGVLKALKAANLSCPADVEIVSSDDSEWLDVFEPRISTIAQPSYQMGFEAAGLLLKRLKAPRRRFETVVLQPSLVVR